MKKKLIKELLKAGLSEELAEFINVSTEDEITAIIQQLQVTPTETNFTELLESEEFTKFVTDNGYDKVLQLSKSLKSGTDKKVTDGIDTFKKGKTPVTTEEQKDNQALLDRLSKLEETNTNAALLKGAKALLEGSEIPKTLQSMYASRLDTGSEVSVQDQVKAFEAEQTAIRNHLIGEASGRGLPMGDAGSDNEMPEGEAESIVGEF